MGKMMKGLLENGKTAAMAQLFYNKGASAHEIKCPWYFAAKQRRILAFRDKITVVSGLSS